MVSLMTSVGWRRAQRKIISAAINCCRESLGTNAKVSTLIQLEKLAKHGLILVSDADVRVPADFLANVTAPLAPSDGERDGVRGNVGLVNCFYRLANPSTTAMQWEAVAINADFWSQVLQSRSLKPLDFALGAIMLTRRACLDEIGGFKSLADCLADDYQLGNRIAKKGHRIALCPVVVECWDSPMDWRAVWKHQLRWARTIRACQPAPYFFSILSNATLWPLLFIIVAAIRQSQVPATMMQIGLLAGIVTAIALLLFRIVIAENLQQRLTPDRKLIAPPWLVPLKDLLQAAIWFLAFTGNTVEWRGKKMKLRPDGTLEQI